MRALLASLVTLVFVFSALVAGANPFLVCDAPTTGGTVEYYELDGLPWLTGTYPPEPDQSLKVDMIDTPVDTPYTVRARACNVWGCSIDSDPFTFTRTDSAQPSGVDLAP